jgi:hypothetical protein
MRFPAPQRVSNERKAHADEPVVKPTLTRGPVGGAYRTAVLAHVVASLDGPEQAPVLGHINDGAGRSGVMRLERNLVTELDRGLGGSASSRGRTNNQRRQ